MATFFEKMFFVTDDESEVYALLRATPLFQQLSFRELRQIESILHERSYMPNEIIFEQGEEGLGLYVVRSGRVSVSSVENGRERELAALNRGQFFGELALLDGSPRSAQARAVEQTELIGFFRPDLQKLLDTNPKIAAKFSVELARWIGKRLRETIQSDQRITTVHTI
jgi:CRP/FNR family transcriptional regulator, cyclic AMP receptor protein